MPARSPTTSLRSSSGSTSRTRESGLAGSTRARFRRRVAVLVGGAACAAVVALTARAGAGQNAQADADARELKAYRLTMQKVRQMNDAYLTFFKSLQSDPQFVALQKTS